MQTLPFDCSLVGIIQYLLVLLQSYWLDVSFCSDIFPTTYAVSSNMLRGKYLDLVEIWLLWMSLLNHDRSLGRFLIHRSPSSLFEYSRSLVNLLMQLILLDLEHMIIEHLLGMHHWFLSILQFCFHVPQTFLSCLFITFELSNLSCQFLYVRIRVFEL